MDSFADGGGDDEAKGDGSQPGGERDGILVKIFAVNLSYIAQNTWLLDSTSGFR